MGALKQGLREALPYMPRHRERNARTQKLTLDTLLDEGRSLSPLPAGALDFILMGYRYHHAFADFLAGFARKPLKPRTLEDLLAMLFAALLTRDQTPVHALVSEGVETAREVFGEHVTGIVNAFLRQVARDLDSLRARAESDPAWLLGPTLSKRWAAEPELLKRMARQLRERPEAGVTAFNAQAEFGSHTVSEFQGANPLQAMDLGSWLFLNWLVEQAPNPKQVLDACAAPGGKTIGLRVLWASRGQKPLLSATDADFRRLERLRANLARWNLASEVKTELVAWGPSDRTDTLNGICFDFILADLPCSGSGTLHSRPDLLIEDLASRVQELAAIQRGLLEALRQRLAPGGKLAVSICSVDPQEIAQVSQNLGGAKPAFSSLDRTEASAEGITAWIF